MENTKKTPLPPAFFKTCLLNGMREASSEVFIQQGDETPSGENTTGTQRKR